MFASQDDEIYFATLGRKEKPEESEFVISDYVKWVSLIDTLVKQERGRRRVSHRLVFLSSVNSLINDYSQKTFALCERDKGYFSYYPYPTEYNNSQTCDMLHKFSPVLHKIAFDWTNVTPFNRSAITVSRLCKKSVNCILFTVVNIESHRVLAIRN